MMEGSVVPEVSDENMEIRTTMYRKKLENCFPIHIWA
jgi:hypothetical protein